MNISLIDILWLIIIAFIVNQTVKTICYSICYIRTKGESDEKLKAYFDHLNEELLKLRNEVIAGKYKMSSEIEAKKEAKKAKMTNTTK